MLWGLLWRSRLKLNSDWSNNHILLYPSTYDEDFEEEEEADAEEEDEDDSEEEGDAEEGGGLTALLLGDGAADEDEEEEEYAGDANPNATHATATTPAGGVKRPAEVEDDAASHEAGTKKAKTA
ncbi:hypothetical protein FIBSPDRAFT_872959 [Athelia psychrophila]|uniref:Uncharacterized protein n=1 Tax=Athelia psychrophila TaxID=1759441 RepID=A0A165Z0C1_9AGAM|nr:hypothetical protein FIBSPDRAFT_872959 [Fibularhizoctonia sp. CBS 109695]